MFFNFFLFGTGWRELISLLRKVAKSCMGFLKPTNLSLGPIVAFCACVLFFVMQFGSYLAARGLWGHINGSKG